MDLDNLPQKLSLRDLGSRKADHIDLAQVSWSQSIKNDSRFYYEPLFAQHATSDLNCDFLGKTFQLPLWISSMTGGAAKAFQINSTLAKACKRFKLGMGLGSCRPLLEGDDCFADFNMRPLLGPDRPLFANLGVAQLEALLKNGEGHKITNLLQRLEADGLIVHVNPLQEWVQPEGDIFSWSPLKTLTELLQTFSGQLMVKEVGQGMGPASLKALMKLPLAAIDFGAFGGTNFSMIESQRYGLSDGKSEVCQLGHTADEMVQFVNEILAGDDSLLCTQFIISGGIKSFLDGHYYMEKLSCSSIFGQATPLLERALEGENSLYEYIENLQQGLSLARTCLSIRS